MRKYTILHTIETAGPGGAETILLNLASHLDSRRFRSVVLLPGSGWLHSQLQEAGVPAYVVRSNFWYDFRLPRAIAALARREKADLIHSHLPDQNFYSSLVGRLMDRQVVVTYHGSQQLSKADGLKCTLKLQIVRRAASAVVVVSDYLKEALEKAGFPSKKIVRIYNGIECGRFALPSQGNLRAELGCSNGTKLIGMVANVRDSKGYEHFVRAAQLVAMSMPQARFVAIGDVHSSTSSSLVSLRRELGLESRLSFVGFRSDVDRVLADLDVFVLSSISEGFSLATIEAMAAGKPVVVTRSGGPEEIVKDRVTGLLVPPADPPALAASICELLNDPALASALGQCAQAMVRNRFSLSEMIREYTRVYERCLSST
ncbi:MAG TPA: glycosyltransferase family 4 protein [Terriglobia bacterium]|nr:glycosyltransferase family 4 protein [Terriglobia bacterium]